MSSLGFQDAFVRNTELCLDGRIIRQRIFPTDAGGYADVYEGLFESRKVAIKVLRPFRLREEKLLRRIWREYLTWSRLSHPNILACLGYSYDFSPGPYTLPSLISPWMENGSVTSYLQRYPDGDRIKLLVGVAKGLSYLHTCDPIIVHGDLRAGNILVSDHGIPCLTDFGLSRVLEEIHGMTTSSDLAGAVRWMSPELFNSESDVNVSVKSDIWAYGMTILEVLSGERPYSAVKNDLIVLGHIRDGKIPPRPQDAKVLEAFNEHVWTACLSCWAREPLSRPSVEEVIYMLISPVEVSGLTLMSILRPEFPMLAAYQGTSLIDYGVPLPIETRAHSQEEVPARSTVVSHSLESLIPQNRDSLMDVPPSPVVQSLPPYDPGEEFLMDLTHENDAPILQHNQLGMLDESRKKRSKWASPFSVFGRGGEKDQRSLTTPSRLLSDRMTDSQTLPEVSPDAPNNLSATNPKKLKKEQEKQAREVEKARRVLMVKTQREQARAVMQKRNQLVKQNTEGVNWESGMHSSMPSA